MPPSVSPGDGELAVLVLLMAVVVLVLTFYWRTPESAGGYYGGCEHPCVEFAWPWGN